MTEGKKNERLIPVHNFHILQTDELFGAVIVDMFDAEPPCWIVEMNERKERKKIETERKKGARPRINNGHFVPTVTRKGYK